MGEKFSSSSPLRTRSLGVAEGTPALATIHLESGLGKAVVVVEDEVPAHLTAHLMAHLTAHLMASRLDHPSQLRRFPPPTPPQRGHCPPLSPGGEARSPGTPGALQTIIFPSSHKVTTQPRRFLAGVGALTLPRHNKHAAAGSSGRAALTLRGGEKRSAGLIHHPVCFLYPFGDGATGH